LIRVRFSRQHSGINRIYANITLPATLQADVLTWVDLDLDLRVHLDGSLAVLDEDEFVENSARFAYPPAVIAQARAAVDELGLCYQEQRFPCNHGAQVMLYEQIRATMFLEK
jgi:protein associated with RNAse G/E